MANSNNQKKSNQNKSNNIRRVLFFFVLLITCLALVSLLTPNSKIEDVSRYLVENKLCADEPTITPGSDFSQINVLIPKAKFPEMVDAIKGFNATSIIRNDLKQLIE